MVHDPDSPDVPADRLHIPVSRRTWLGGTASTAAMVTTGCTKAEKWETKPASVSEGKVDLDLAEYPELSTPGGMVAIKPTSLRKPMLVMRLEGDAFGALSLNCPHFGCVVRWDNEQQLLVCPCHNSKFDDKGRRLSGPAKESLQSFPAQRVGTHVQIQLPKE